MPYSNKNEILSFLTYLLSVLIFNLFMMTPLFAKDLGVVGQTYPIQEDDFLQFIQHHISDMKENGEWQKIQDKMQQDVQDHSDRPKSSNIGKATVKKEWIFDPSIVLSHDLRDGNGHIFARAGTLFNPLDKISLHSILVFYDADDESQIEWVKKIIKLPYAKKIKLILVNGSLSSQMRIFHQKIYFDQMGRIINHFQITHVPAIVTQVGNRLKISEVVV